MQKKGFTLVELLMVVIIIGILATIAVPQYVKATERSRSSKARAALNQISKAEKMYRAELNQYGTITSSGALTNLDSYVEMTEVINDADWDYSVTITTGTNPTFTASAFRQSGPNLGEVISVTDAGTPGGNFNP